MKTVTFYLLQRFWWFLLWFKAWFKNLNGIKLFSEQSMASLQTRLLKRGRNIRKRNKILKDKVNNNIKELEWRRNYPIIDPDEFSAIAGRLFNYFVVKAICLTGESFFNYFVSKSIIRFSGLMALLAQIFLALLATWASVLLFEHLFQEILNEPEYKKQADRKRNWKKLILLAVIGIVYQVLVYDLCKVRGLAIEGHNTSSIISDALIILGMLLPVVAGYFAYERRRYISAYTNTCRIQRLEHRNAKYIRTINANIQDLETYFKKKCESFWSLTSEFRTYKSVYNVKHGIDEEDLCGHFCENKDSFIAEAVRRYHQQLLSQQEFDQQSVSTPKGVLNLLPGSYANAQNL